MCIHFCVCICVLIVKTIWKRAKAMPCTTYIRVKFTRRCSKTMQTKGRISNTVCIEKLLDGIVEGYAVNVQKAQRWQQRFHAKLIFMHLNMHLQFGEFVLYRTTIHINLMGLPNMAEAASQYRHKQYARNTKRCHFNELNYWFLWPITPKVNITLSKRGWYLTHIYHVRGCTLHIYRAINATA